MNLKRKEVMSWRKQEKIHFPGGKGHGNLYDWVKNYTALHFYRSVPSTVPMRILLWVIHLFLKSFSGENKHSWFPGIKTKQTILRQLAGQAGHSPGSLWGCPLCLRAWQVSLRRGAHQLLSAMTEARHLRHEWWQSQGFLVGTLLCPAPLAVLCHPTACTESMGQPQPRHWALDHRATRWQFLKDCKAHIITCAVTDRSWSPPVPHSESEGGFLVAVLVSRVAQLSPGPFPVPGSAGSCQHRHGSTSEHSTQHSVFTYMCWAAITGGHFKWFHLTIWFPFTFQSSGSIYQ